MKDFKIKIGRVTTSRDRITEEITLKELLDGIKSGRWKDSVQKVRGLPKGKAREQAKKKLPAVWLHDQALQVFDWEDAEGTPFDTKHILARFRSAGGNGYAIVVPIDGDDLEATRRALQKKYGVSSNSGQVAFDRARFVSYDPKTFINWKAVPLEAVVNGTEPGFRESHAEQHYEEAKTGKQPLDNSTGLAVYSFLRNRMTQKETVTEMESLPWKSVSCSTPKKRAKYYTKWERQYGEEFSPAIRIGKSRMVASTVKPEEQKTSLIDGGPVDWNEHYKESIISDKDFVKLATAVAISPFIPVSVPYFGKDLPVGTTLMAAGRFSSGKNYIEKLQRDIAMLLEDSRDSWMEHRMNEIMGVNAAKSVRVGGKPLTPAEEKEQNKDYLNKEKEARRMISNFRFCFGIQNTHAAFLGSLSELPAMLVHATDFSTMVSSTKQDFNSLYISDLLKFTEGEDLSRDLKKSDKAYIKTVFDIRGDSYRHGMLLAGTPKVIRNFFSNRIENGFLSRFTFVVLGTSVHDREDFLVPTNVERYIDPIDLIVRLQQGDKNRDVVAEYDRDWIKQVKVKIKTENQNTLVEGLVDRSVREALKRAAIYAWMEGERKRISLSRSDIQKQFDIMEKSFAFAKEIQDHELDRFGNSTLAAKMERAERISKGASLTIGANGDDVELPKKRAERVWRMHHEDGLSYVKIAEMLGVSDSMIRKIMYRLQGKKWR